MNLIVIGAGAWGTALAQALASDGTPVQLWAREVELVDEVNRQHTNSLFLPSAKLANNITATNQIGDLSDLAVILAVVPAQHLAAVIGQLPDQPRDLVLCAKGIEAGSGRLMADVAAAAVVAAETVVWFG